LASHAKPGGRGLFGGASQLVLLETQIQVLYTRRSSLLQSVGVEGQLARVLYVVLLAPIEVSSESERVADLSEALLPLSRRVSTAASTLLERHVCASQLGAVTPESVIIDLWVQPKLGV